jgi:hypothetical protein
MFQSYVASVSYRYCKTRSGCCTCCNGYARMVQVYVPNVSSVSDVCCKCFHLDVTYTCMLHAYVKHIHACCMRMLNVFRCFVRRLQMLHLDVAYACNDFQVFLECLLQVFQTYVSCVSSVFFYILQLLHPDILKVDQVLHIGCA